MSWLSRLPVVSLVVLLIVAGGCDPKEERAENRPAAPAQRKLPDILVPQEVQGRWKAVLIAVSDQQGGGGTCTVEIGSTLELEDTQLSIEVLNFLPAFIMDGTRMTSAGNETSNPAALVVIRERGEEIFRGWLFSRYPGVFSFQHSRYSFTLVDFVPAEKLVDKKN